VITAFLATNRSGTAGQWTSENSIWSSLQNSVWPSGCGLWGVPGITLGSVSLQFEHENYINLALCAAAPTCNQSRWVTDFVVKVIMSFWWAILLFVLSLFICCIIKFVILLWPVPFVLTTFPHCLLFVSVRTVCWNFGVVRLEWYPCCRLQPATSNQ